MPFRRDIGPFTLISVAQQLRDRFILLPGSFGSHLSLLPLQRVKTEVRILLTLLHIDYLPYC